MPQVQGTIENVQGIPGANGKTRYEVTIGGQVYATWKPDIARQANERIGQMVVANVTIKPSQDGQFTNYYFDGIQGVQAQLPGQAEIPLTQPIPQQPPLGLPGAVAAAPIPMAQPEQYARDMRPEAVARITKLSALQTAGNIVGHLFDGAGPEALAQAEEEVLAMAKRFYMQVMNAPQTLDDEVVEALVAAAPEPSEPETW